MKVLELLVENLLGVRDGPYHFAEANGTPRAVVVLANDAAGALLQTIAALIEMVRAPVPAPRHLAWWAGRHGKGEARLRVRWALSEGEAARAGVAEQTAASEWRLGPGDPLPRELEVEGALSQPARLNLARYVFLDANRSSVWIGGPNADPLAAALAGIAARDIAATRVCCRTGMGMVGYSTPDTLARVSRAVSDVFPALRVERVACAAGEIPAACVRGGKRVDLNQLSEAERDAIHVAAAIHVARLRGGVVFVDRPELRVPREAHARWLDWLTGLAGTNQLIVWTGSPKVHQPQAGGGGA